MAPGAEIGEKASVGSRQARAFAREDLACLTQLDGRYTDPQSLQSEDTVTWSVFGLHVPVGIVDAVINLAYSPKEEAHGQWTRSFWRRLPHPDTGRESSGPETDVLIEASPGWCYAIEAKWLADLKDKQGRNKDRTQLDMRSESVVARGGVPGQRGAIVIVPSPRQYPFAKQGSVFARYFDVDGDRYRPREPALRLEATALTWTEVAQLLDQVTQAEEVAKYLRWRLSHVPAE